MVAHVGETGDVMDQEIAETRYRVRFEHDDIQHYPLYELQELIKFAMVGVGSRIALYSYETDCYVRADVLCLEDTRTSNMRVQFETGCSDWVDLRRFKFQVLSQENTDLFLISGSPTTLRETRSSKVKNKRRKQQVYSFHDRGDVVESTIVSSNATPYSSKRATKSMHSKAVAGKSPAGREGVFRHSSPGFPHGMKDDDGSYSVDETQELAGVKDIVEPGDRVIVIGGDGEKGGRVPSEVGGEDYPVVVLRAPSLTSLRKGTRLAILWDQNEEYYPVTVKNMRRESRHILYQIEYEKDSYREWTTLADREFYLLNDFTAYERYLDSQRNGCIPAENIKKVKQGEEDRTISEDEGYEWVRRPFTRVEHPSDEGGTLDLQKQRRRTLRQVAKGR